MQVNKNLIRFGALTGALLLGAGAGTLWAMGRTPDGMIPDGVHIAGMECGKQPVALVRAELDGWRKARVDEPLTLGLAPEARVAKRWTPKRSTLGADVDIPSTINEALAAGQQTGPIGTVMKLFTGPRSVNISPRWTLNAAKAQAYLKRRIAPLVQHPPRDAKLLVEKSGFRVAPEQPGGTLDLDRAVAAIQSRLGDPSADPVLLPVRVVAPHIVATDLQGIDGEMSRFRTHYSETGNRAKNIQVACRHINGTVLKPGDIFSYNKVVGPRDHESGFHMAPQIVQGRLEPGMGGGVCQVSSTLYNAVLLADLKVVHREHHAFPVHYLPAGRDATVAYGDKDFVFQNNTNGVIAVAADGADGTVSMRILGHKTPGREVCIERTNISTWGPGEQVIHDATRPRGEQETVDRGRSGHRVTVWRVVKVNGHEVKRELISRDYYQPFPRVVSIGTRETSPKPSASPGDGGVTPATPDSTRIPPAAIQSGDPTPE